MRTFSGRCRRWSSTTTHRTVRPAPRTGLTRRPRPRASSLHSWRPRSECRCRPAGGGAPLAEISRLLYRSKPDAQLRLFGRVLDRLDTVAGGLVIYSTLTAADVTDTGFLQSHSGGVIDLLSPSQAAGVRVP